MEDWWGLLLTELLMTAEYELLMLDSKMNSDDSWEDIALLVEAAEHFEMLRQTYENKQRGTVHVEVDFISE